MMQGSAKQLFVEKEGSSPFKSTMRGRRRKSWPLLEKMAEQGCLAYIDLFLAENLLRLYPASEESAAALLCYLSMISRNGHMCIHAAGPRIYPHPAESFAERWSRSDEDLEPIRPEELAQFSSLLVDGLAKLPGELLAENPLNGTLPGRPLCKLGNEQAYLYFQKSWVHETRCLEAYQQLLATKPAITFESSAVHAFLAKEDRLLPEQRQAIQNACMRRLTLISGGPGTGKTFTAGYLIKIIWSLLTSQQKQSFQIALAAPTGKAASNLQKSLSKAVGDLPDFPEIQAKTLHKLLNIKRMSKSKNETSSFLAADVVLVDESSMIDANVMGMLLSAIKPGARLVLLGDAHQLPAVESGAVFKELMAMNARDGGNELTKCVRAELRSIVDFAAAIKAGNYAEAKKHVSDNSQGISVVHLDDPSEIESIYEQLYAYAAPFFRLPKPLIEKDCKVLLEHFNRFRILSPLRKGSFGVESLNQLFVKKMQKTAKSKENFISPIMIVRNDYRLHLFNGETGVLIRQPTGLAGGMQLQQGDYALFPGTNGEECRKIPAFLLPHFEYAYALSVHKSQGSEFEKVLLMMPKGAEVFGREVLYTAVTRAKKSLEIWSDSHTFKKTIEKKSERVSGLMHRFFG